MGRGFSQFIQVTEFQDGLNWRITTGDFMKIPSTHLCLVATVLVATTGCTSSEKKSAGSGLGGCTVTVSPSADNYAGIQGALDDAKTGDTVCLAAGTYDMKRSVKLSSAASITLKGTGATRDDVLLDFSAQSGPDGGVEGSEGVLVTTSGFTVENLSIKNTLGNGIKVQGKGQGSNTNATFRNIKVGWDTASSENGAYAIYPTFADGVLVEDCEAYGAPDAGYYAGVSSNVTFRRNVAHDNVLGIEIENTTNAEAHDNDVHDNAAGFLLDLLPGLQKKTQGFYLVYNNTVKNNNHVNFGKPGSTPKVMPQGTGMMVLAASDLEIKGNTFEGNGGAAITIVSYDTVDLATVLQGGTPAAYDPDTNRYPERVYVHDNTYTNNGQDPQDIYLTAATAANLTTIPYNVFWDGTLKQAQDGGLITLTDADAKICLGTAEQASFLDFHGAGLITPSVWTTDATAHICTLTPIPPLSVP